MNINVTSVNFSNLFGSSTYSVMITAKAYNNSRTSTYNFSTPLAGKSLGDQCKPVRLLLVEENAACHNHVIWKIIMYNYMCAVQVAEYKCMHELIQE